MSEKTVNAARESSSPESPGPNVSSPAKKKSFLSTRQRIYCDGEFFSHLDVQTLLRAQNFVLINYHS